MIRTLFVLVSSALLLSTPAWAAEPARRPNIVFILADDLGYTDVACFGSKYYETPNIDRLAAQGMKLTEPSSLPELHADAGGADERAIRRRAPASTPSAASTASTGASARCGRSTMSPNLPLDRDTIAKQLKAAGYATGMFGKWHLGQNGDYHPGQRGFDEAIVTHGRSTSTSTRIPKTEYPEGHVPGRLPHRQGGRLHHAAQGRAVLPLPAALRRPLAASRPSRS